LLKRTPNVIEKYFFLAELLIINYISVTNMVLHK